MSKTLKIYQILFIVLLVIIGGVHVYDAPDSFEEAAYKGWLFYANGLGALVASVAIWQQWSWGKTLGLLIALGSIAAYIASRTIGLPLIPAEPDAWFEPLGVLSLLAEGAFVGVYVLSLRQGK